MAIRTTAIAVEAILADNWDGSTSVDPFIEAASSIVDDIHTNDDDSLCSDTKLEIIERWLSAHMYHVADPLYQSKNTSKAGGQFQNQSGMGLDGSRYGQMAKKLDPSGYLEALDNKGVVNLKWLGTDPDA